jgi:hypothetical protein
MSAGLFSLILHINLGTSEEERRRMQNRFLDEGMEVRRWPAFARDWIKRKPEGLSQSSYADALNLRTALREARKRLAPAVLLISGEAEISRGSWAKLSEVPIPGDWGMLVLGGKSTGQPGVTAVTHFDDWTAVAIKARHYAEVARLLKCEKENTLYWKPGSRCEIPPTIKVYQVSPPLLQEYKPTPAARPI